MYINLYIVHVCTCITCTCTYSLVVSITLALQYTVHAHPDVLNMCCIDGMFGIQYCGWSQCLHKSQSYIKQCCQVYRLIQNLRIFEQQVMYSLVWETRINTHFSMTSGFFREPTWQHCCLLYFRIETHCCVWVLLCVTLPYITS